MEIQDTIKTVLSLTVLLKNRDPVLLVDCQVPRLKLFQFAQVHLGEEKKSTWVQRKEFDLGKENKSIQSE